MIMGKLNGLDELFNRLDEMSENAEKLSGTHEYSFDEFLNSEFMEANTDQSNFYEFVNASNLEIHNQSDFDKIAKTSEWNEYVQNHSTFDNWQDMFDTAMTKMISKKLFE